MEKNIPKHYTLSSYSSYPFFACESSKSRISYLRNRNTYYIYIMYVSYYQVYVGRMIYQLYKFRCSIQSVGIQQHDFVVPGKCESHHSIHVLLERAKRKHFHKKMFWKHAYGWEHILLNHFLHTYMRKVFCVLSSNVKGLLSYYNSGIAKRYGAWCVLV